MEKRSLVEIIKDEKKNFVKVTRDYFRPMKKPWFWVVVGALSLMTSNYATRHSVRESYKLFPSPESQILQRYDTNSNGLSISKIRNVLRDYDLVKRENPREPELPEGVKERWALIKLWNLPRNIKEQFNYETQKRE